MDTIFLLFVSGQPSIPIVALPFRDRRTKSNCHPTEEAPRNCLRIVIRKNFDNRLIHEDMEAHIFLVRVTGAADVSLTSHPVAIRTRRLIRLLARVEQPARARSHGGAQRDGRLCKRAAKSRRSRAVQRGMRVRAVVIGDPRLDRQACVSEPEGPGSQEKNRRGADADHATADSSSHRTSQILPKQRNCEANQRGGDCELAASD